MQTSTPRRNDYGAPLWVHRFALVTAVATLVLVFAGALVTSTGSGLAVPDWPLSFGQVFPPMVGGVLFEHGHRLVAAFVGVLTVTLVGLLWQWEPRAWVRRLAWGALLAVVLQGTLGGVTVLWRLPTAVSVLHACLAQVFFCLMVILAVSTAPGWHLLDIRWRDQQRPSLRLLATVATVVVYLQLILGALMRHTGAGLAIPDFPLAFGRLLPPLESQTVVIHFLHRLGAVAVVLSLGWTIIRVLNRYRGEPLLRRPALVLAGLLVGQLVLGAVTIWSRGAVLPVTAHVAVGAAVLATCLFLTLRAYRLVASAGNGYRRKVLDESFFPNR